MENILTIRFLVSAVYLGAVFAYAALLRSGRQRAVLPTSLLGAGLALNAVEIVVRGAESGAAGGAPFAGLSGFLSIFAFLLGLTYFVLERLYRQYRISSLGAFHVPVIFVLHACSVFIKQPIAEIPQINTGLLFTVHVMSTIFAYAALTAGCVAGIAYLLLDKQLRNKKFGMLMRGLPNLELVAKVNTAAVKIGTPLLAFGLLVGLHMGYHKFGAAYKWDFKVWVSFVAVVIFTGQLAMRRFAAWSGRRGVIISVIGFVIIVTNATIVNYFFSQLHRFK